jgi:polar amino acid transport system substrate-binding protein
MLKFWIGLMVFLLAVTGGLQRLPDAAAATAPLAGADDLKDKRIGVLIGSIHDAYATKNFPRATVLQYKTLSDMILAIKTGKIDAAFYVRESLLDLFRNDQELGTVGEPLFTVPIAIGFNRKNDSMRQEFNAFLKQARSNGLHQDMVRRWIIDGSTRMPEIANSEANGRLIVGIASDKGLPFTAIQHGRLTGFDIELAERFAAYLGKRVEYRDMEFGGLVAAAATGKIDLISSTLAITAERKKQVDFSDPYYELATSIVALKKNIAGSAAAVQNETTVDTPGFFKGIIQSFYSNIIHENRYLLIFDGLKTTVIISVFATVVGTLGGALVCFLRMSRKPLFSVLARLYIAILRGVPVLVLLMLIFYVVFASVRIDPVVVAVLAFGMNFAAYTAEIFRSGIEGIDKGQTEAGISLGFTRVQTFLHIILPQMVQRVLPVYKGEFISLVKMTSIVGYIAVQDLTKASDIIRSRTFDAFFPLIMVAVLYFLISWTLLQLLEYAERRCDPKLKRREAVTG